MLLDIKCDAVTSVHVHLKFDDEKVKDCVVAIGDLVDVLYNANGVRKHIIGRVVKVSAVGSDPTGWYITVDGSDDFEGKFARFSPMSILDIDILRKATSERIVRTPLGDNAAPFLRVVKGRLQYSKDGFNWKPIKYDDRDVIEPQEGTVPAGPDDCHRPEDPTEKTPEDDDIEDAVW
ncbi:MAG: hypothetical protein IKR19_08520 [Acholeplasmatales bacterium]|nr:hypothetical protein [Acholeplasmatales bacterium]